MYTRTAVTSALALAAGLVRAEDAIFVGDKASDVPLNTWEQVGKRPNATSTAKFPGVDFTKSYPGQTKDGWQLTVSVKNNITGPGDSGFFTGTTMAISYPGGNDTNASADDSWHFCLYTFTVHPSSGTSDGFAAGTDPSCKNLVQSECIEDLKKNAIKNYAKGSCPEYKTTASCLRDLDEQSGLALSVSASNASDYFIRGAPFYRQVDGTYAKEGDNADTYDAANSQPMAVIAVFGPSGDSDDKPIAQAACVMPNAPEAESAASATAASLLSLGTASIAAALALVL